MKKSIAFSILTFFIIAMSAQVPILPVSFPSSDGILITGEYIPGDDSSSPIILLCHQAGWSRGEYQEIGPKLRELGYSSLAIDQRSGGSVNDVINATHIAAKKENKPTTFLDAEQDIIAAINYIKKAFPKKSNLYLWGSSYSAALAIKIGAQNENVDAVISFSPGEYFDDLGKSDHYISDAALKLNKPVFITSGKDEVSYWSTIFDNIPAENKVGFIPKGNGKHGSRNLWKKFDDHQEYWDAVTAFLYSL